MTQSVKLNGNSKGIEELIELLKNKGVVAGKAESTRIVEDAERRADWLITQAKEEAARIRAEAERDAKFIHQAGKDNLHTAFRDIKLRLKDELSNQFANQLKELIQHELANPDTLKSLLQQAASRVELKDEPMDIILPDKVLGLEALRQDPGSLKSGPLMEVLSDVTRKLFQSEVHFKTGSSHQGGIVFSLKEGEIHVELTDDALTELLLHHLQPRFRAVLEGVIS